MSRTSIFSRISGAGDFSTRKAVYSFSTLRATSMSPWSPTPLPTFVCTRNWCCVSIDSKLRGCDLVQLRVRDVAHGDRIATRTIVMQQKTQRPVQFEITEPTRKAVLVWIRCAALKTEDYLFPSRIRLSPHLSTRQYARIVETWVAEIGLDVGAYGTHSMCRTKPSLIYRRTKNLRAVQLLLGHTKLESTVRYLGIEVNDALEMAEQTDV